MKKLFHCPLFSLVVFFFSACDPYTVENGYTERISAGSVVILPAQCVELFHFPLLGDFPLQFRYADRNLISPEDQSPGHYFISSGGEVLKRERPCAKDFSVLSSASKPVPVGSEQNVDEEEPPPKPLIVLVRPVFEINLAKAIDSVEEGGSKNPAASENQPLQQYRSPSLPLRQQKPVSLENKPASHCSRERLPAQSFDEPSPAAMPEALVDSRGLSAHQSLNGQSSCPEEQKNGGTSALKYKYNFY